LAQDAAAVAPLRSDAMPHRDMLAWYVALLCLGKSDFEVITGVARTGPSEGRQDWSGSVRQSHQQLEARRGAETAVRGYRVPDSDSTLTLCKES
jgi:hypothetical protein